MKVKEICYSITDGSHNPPQGIEQSEFLMLSSKNIFDNEITIDDPRFLSEEDFQQEDKRTKIVPGDVLLTIVGTIGRTAVVSEQLPRFTLQRSVAVLHPNNDICLSRFLMYALRSKRAYIERTAKGVAQKGIYLGEVGEIDLPIPTIVQQETVVDILDKVGLLIQAYQRQLSIFNQLIKARFVEMFGDLADPACGWKTCRLAESCENSDDIKCGPFGTQLSKDEYQSSGIPVWEIPQINSAFAIAPEHFLTETKAKQLQAYTLAQGDIVMSRKGNVGKCALFPPDKQSGVLHSDVLRIRVSTTKADPCFMMCQLHYSRDVIRQIEQVSSGAIMAGVNVTKLKEIMVKLPPLELQKQFAAFVSQVDKSKLSIQASLDQLETLKQSLMQKYFG